MWLKGGRAMGPSALVGVIALIAIEYAASGGKLTGGAPTGAAPISALPRADPTFHARLVRGMCLGACPNYTVEIDAAGLVTFTGDRSTIEPSVACQGRRQWRAAPAAVARLQARVDASGFFGFKDAYVGDMTDMPRFSVTVTRGGRTKTVTDYIGLTVGMPKAMVDLEDAIDIAAGDRACVETSAASVKAR
jgi:hypothetical protein